jgi:hypothetical protein
MMIDAQLRWLFRRRRVREAVSRGCQASRLLAAFIVNLLYHTLRNRNPAWP